MTAPTVQVYILKEPKLILLPNALNWVFESDWNAFDFSKIEFKKVFNPKFRIF